MEGINNYQKYVLHPKILITTNFFIFFIYIHDNQNYGIITHKKNTINNKQKNTKNLKKLEVKYYENENNE